LKPRFNDIDLTNIFRLEMSVSQSRRLMSSQPTIDNDCEMSGYTEAARPFHVGAGKNAVLLVHGFMGSPYGLREFGEHLASRGFRVYAPLLPGHGTSKEDMIRTGRADWIREAEAGLKMLQEEAPEHLFVSGHSMGGTLTLYLGATHPEVDALAPICGPLYLTDWRLRFLLPIFKPFFKYSPLGEEPPDILDRRVLEDPVVKESRRRYDRPAIPCVTELLTLIHETREKLSEVRQPILVIQARKDGVVPPGNAEHIFQHVASTEKRILWLENSAHAATMDFEKQTLFKEAAEFFHSLTIDRRRSMT